MPIATNPETGDVVFLAPDGQWQKAQTAINQETSEMVAFDGKGWSPVPASKGVFSYIDDAVRSFANGVTFGWMDELAAKMDETFGRGTYEANVQQERARDAQIPLAIQLPAEIAGAVGSTMIVAPVGAWQALAAVSSKFPQWMRFATLGTAEGALAGAGSATEGNRAEGAAGGAALGAAVGAAAPAVVRGVQNTISAVRGAVQPSAGAAADIGRAMVRDELNPAEISTRLAAAQVDRPGATLADVGGENVRGLVERVAQTPGAGRTKVIPALTTRQEEQLGRLSSDLRDLTGTQKTARQTIDETIAERATASKPLYDDALSFDAAKSADVVGTWEKVTASGYGKAIINSSDFRKTLQTEYGISNAADAPLMVQIDAFKKQADDIAAGFKQGGAGNRARVVAGMRDKLLEAVDEANPAYPKARAAWSGPTKFLESIDEGRGILSSKAGAEEVNARLAAMSANEKEGFRIGAISAIQGKMGNDPAKLADLTKYLRSPEVKAKVAAIMPTKEAAKAWERRLEFEVKSSELVGRSLGGSATARRLAEQNNAGEIFGDLVLDALTSGPASVSVLRRMFTAGPKWLRDTLRSRTDKELASALLNPEKSKDLAGILAKARKQRTRIDSPTSTAAAVAGTITANE